MRAVLFVLATIAAIAHGQVTPQSNLLPVNITVTSAPYDIIATPITPVAPYSQRLFQCNVTGDTRFPIYATGTFPLNVKVPVGQRVRIIFANGNLNGNTVTQNGEPGVIVQQGGSPIVQQAGGASPIVQKVGSPIVQQQAPPAALVVQQTPTVVQAAPSYPQAVVVQQPASPVVQQNPGTTPAATPAPTTKASPPPTPATVQPTPAAATPPTPAVVEPTPAAATPPTPAVVEPTPAAATPPTPAVVEPTPAGRRLLQEDNGLVPGGPNNGQVEYVALASANNVPGFFAGSTQFGVPYVEFTATEAARGQIAAFKGVLEVAQVVKGVPLYPFRPNPNLSPECQVNVNFSVA